MTAAWVSSPQYMQEQCLAMVLIIIIIIFIIIIIIIIIA